MARPWSLLVLPWVLEMGFFQACWEVLKVYIVNAFHEFHARGTFKKNLNATFLSLIS